MDPDKAYWVKMRKRKQKTGNKAHFKITAKNGKYHINGVSQKQLRLSKGQTYVFDYSDSSNTGHPFKFSTAEDGTHNGGTEYTMGITRDDTNKTITVAVDDDVPNELYYYCQVISYKGGKIVTTGADC